MSNFNQLAIAEIAGRDSVAAAVAAVHERGFVRVLPTIAFTGTEIGDERAPHRAVETLREVLGDEAEVLDPLELSDPALWSALNSRYAATLQRRFGIYSPCLACHLYLHLLRVPVSWAYYDAPVVAGERDTHDGRVKLSQTRSTIDASMRVLAHGDVELIEPVRLASGEEVARLVGGAWDEGEAQLGCLLSGNYKEPDGSVIYDAEAHDRYVREFFEPVGVAIIEAWRATLSDDISADTGPVDYEAIVRSVITG